MFEVDGNRLRVCRKLVQLASHAKALSEARFIVVQHVLPDTEEFIGALVDGGAEISVLISKSYSEDPDSARRLIDAGIRVVQTGIDAQANEAIAAAELDGALRRSADDGKRIVVLDLGGFFAAQLARPGLSDPQQIAGVVEDTTSGLRQYERLLDSIQVPVLSVARGRLKEIEATFVGKAVVASIESILSDIGVSLPGRRAVVVGYGMIGAAVAEALIAQGLRVDIHDTRQIRRLAAFTRGYGLAMPNSPGSGADLVVSATGALGLRLEAIESCEDGAVLASAGSLRTEFDIAGMDGAATGVQQIGPHLQRYTFSNGRRVLLANRGAPVNFITKSVPTEVMDLVFAEIIVCALGLLSSRGNSGLPRRIGVADDDAIDDIAGAWIEAIGVSASGTQRAELTWRPS